MTDPFAPPSSMFSNVREFTLSDAQGNSHTYQTHLHAPASGGMEIMWTLTALGAEPLGRLVHGFASSGALMQGIAAGMQSATNRAGDTGGPFEALSDMEIDIDFASLGADLRKVLMLLDSHDLARRIMSRTLRDGKRLSDDAAFNEAYVGNYWEYQRAVWKVVMLNRFFPLLGTSSTE